MLNFRQMAVQLIPQLKIGEHTRSLIINSMNWEHSMLLAIIKSLSVIHGEMVDKN